MIYDPDKLQEIEAQRQSTIRDAINQTDKIIMDIASANPDLLDILTAELAKAVVLKTAHNVGSLYTCRFTQCINNALNAAEMVIANHPEDEATVRNWLWSEVAKASTDKLSQIFLKALRIHDQERESREE